MVGYHQHYASMNMPTDLSGEPVSRTHQYRKVMKPLLERKRRARINRCLDELKDLMSAQFQEVGFRAPIFSMKEKLRIHPLAIAQY